MRWGRQWGNYWGDDSASNIVMTNTGQDPPTAHVSWDSFHPDARYHVYVDGKYYDQTKETEASISFESEGRHYVEVKISGPGNIDEDIAPFLDNTPGMRARITWTASVSTDLDHYRIMWDKGDSSPLELLGRTKATETEFITEELGDGTYEFRVDPVDRAGNITISSSTDALLISKFPEAPTSLVLDSYDTGTTTASFSFTEPVSSAVNHRVYHNNGSGKIDYSVIRATVTSPGSTFDLAIAEGNWRVGIRAFDGTDEEDNTDIRVDFDIDSTDTLLDAPPNVPEALSVIPAPGAAIAFKVNYSPFEERGEGSSVNFYTNDGLGGDIDFDTPVASTAIPEHTAQEPIMLEIEGTSSPLLDGRTYLCAAKASTSSGRESQAISSVSITVDGSSPSDISELTLTAVNFEQE